MAIQLTRMKDATSVNTTWVHVEADGPTNMDLSQEDATQVARALITSWQLALGDSARRHRIERILLRMGLELEGLEVLRP